MGLEIAGALAIAVLVIWVVFEPLLASPRPELMIPEPDAAEETRRGIALIALKEIEFDRETGKLSDDDYEMLKERYSAEALSALAEAERVPPTPEAANLPTVVVSCRACGPRPELDALFCSWCGRRIGI